LEPLYVPRDTKILDYSRTLLFNDIVNYLRAAGYGGGYLFIDDIENLVDQMARRERIEFAKEFGLCTVRPGYANTAYRFFSNVLTTHQQASLALSTAWGDAGLAAIGRLDPSCRLVLTMHDSLLYEVPQDKAAAFASAAGEVVSRRPPWATIDMKADIEIDDRFGEMKKERPA
jgi:hypothetical protein